MNSTRSVLVLQMLSFLTFVVGTGTEKSGTTGKTTLPDPQVLAGWAILTFILLTATDIDSTAELASAMAMLIFISVLLIYGVDLFNRLSDMVGGKRFTE